MILHLGGDISIPVKNIIAILDFESIKDSHINDEFISVAENEGYIYNVTGDEPKSYVITNYGNEKKIYMSPISSVTLFKRIGYYEGNTAERQDNQKGDMNDK